jgi:D-alanyl-D-alanine dipeptidase
MRASRRCLLLAALLVTACAAQHPKVFRITPLRPVEDLRREALATHPPPETGKRAPDLVELVTLDPTIHLDVRYASSDNFLSTPVYTQARAFLQRPAAEALVAANAELRRQGWALLIHDAYRPWYVTKVFWEATPDDKKDFVADPAKGSKHNRGCAVDLTLYALASGKPAVMPSLYDEMSPRAAAAYPGGTAEQRRRREILRAAMEAHGFTVNPREWWHFDYRDWEQYPILNVPFEELASTASPRAVGE